MLTDTIEDTLTPLNITPDEFSELVIRLLDYGVINREESQIEAKLYDRFIECQSQVEDYLSVIKIRLLHDTKFLFIRAFPPGAVVPGMPDPNDDAFNNGFRIKPSQHEIATILVLRVEYEKSLREGQVDEKGCVLLSLEGLVISFNNLLKRSLPDSLSERKILFKRLRQLRLINFNAEADLESPEIWISIQPSITSFVSDDVLNSLSTTGTIDSTIDNSATSSSTTSIDYTVATEKETSDVL